MESEVLAIFNKDEKKIGEAPRKDVHLNGYLHETFHCWVTEKAHGKTYLYFQLRSAMKKDYPNMLDITAAGHLLAHENVQDGIRELEEEIGLRLTFPQLRSLGTIQERLIHGDVIDHEICRVYHYEIDSTLPAFQLQKSEVSGIVKVELDEFERLISGQIKEVRISGFEEDSEGVRYNVDKFVNKEAFVPHEQHYFHAIIQRINNH